MFNSNIGFGQNNQGQNNFGQNTFGQSKFGQNTFGQNQNNGFMNNNNSNTNSLFAIFLLDNVGVPIHSYHNLPLILQTKNPTNVGLFAYLTISFPMFFLINTLLFSCQRLWWRSWSDKKIFSPFKCCKYWPTAFRYLKKTDLFTLINWKTNFHMWTMFITNILFNNFNDL